MLQRRCSRTQFAVTITASTVDMYYKQYKIAEEILLQALSKTGQRSRRKTQVQNTCFKGLNHLVNKRLQVIYHELGNKIYRLACAASHKRLYF